MASRLRGAQYEHTPDPRPYLRDAMLNLDIDATKLKMYPSASFSPPQRSSPRRRPRSTPYDPRPPPHRPHARRRTHPRSDDD